MPKLKESRPPSAPRTVVLVVGGMITRAAVPWLCEHVRRLLERDDADLITCDVAELDDPDATALDALARLQLTARRMGRSIRLRHTQGKLRDLLAITGLCEELPEAAMPGRRAETDPDRRRSRSR